MQELLAAAISEKPSDSNEAKLPDTWTKWTLQKYLAKRSVQRSVHMCGLLKIGWMPGFFQVQQI